MDYNKAVRNRDLAKSKTEIHIVSYNLPVHTEQLPFWQWIHYLVRVKYNRQTSDLVRLRSQN